jgi:hypothetical protein
MKYLFFICILLFALPALAQRAEVVKDSISFSTTINECGDTVYLLTEIIEFRGGRKVTNSQPVGFDENNPCSGIKYRDTLTLINIYANPLIDYGRQQAEKAIGFIFQNRSLKTFTGVNQALVRFGMPNMLRQIERTFADSLVGNYILVRPGVANANVTVTKTAAGAVRIRVNAQNIFPLTIYSDRWMLVNNIAGTDQNVDLYQIEPRRWVSLLGNYQLVKSARQVVQRGIK